MNPALIAVIGGGVAAGLGVYLLVVHILMPSRVSLVEAIAPLAPAPTRILLDRNTEGPASRLDRWQAALEARLVASRRFTTPDADLALIEWTRGRFLITRITWTAAAVLCGPVLTAIWALLGAGIPPAVPVLAGVAIAALVWVMVGLYVRDQAAERRLEMREALVSYLTILALTMAAGVGRTAAMQSTAAASEAWPFRRLDARIASSVRAGLPADAGLKDLSHELGVEELTDVAEILNTAGVQGAQVFETLLARADSLRSQMRSELEAEESSRSMRTRIPNALLVMVTLGFMLYPLIIGIAG